MNAQDQTAAQENLAQVIVQYKIRKLCSRLAEIKGLRPQERAHLLRHHSTESINEEHQIATRERLDSLLHGLSVLEIGYLAGVLAKDPTVMEAVVDLLQLQEVCIYYREHYPLTLPGQLLKRVRGENNVMTEPDPHWFGRVLALDRTFSRSAMRYFLLFVDGFWFEEVNFGHLSRSLQSEESCLRAISTPDRDRNALQNGIVGAEQFLIFCDDLVALREETTHDVLKHALLDLYRYWLRVRSDRLLEILLIARSNFPPVPGDGMPTPSDLQRLFSSD